MSATGDERTRWQEVVDSVCADLTERRSSIPEAHVLPVVAEMWKRRDQLTGCNRDHADEYTEVNCGVGHLVLIADGQGTTYDCPVCLLQEFQDGTWPSRRSALREALAQAIEAQKFARTTGDSSRGWNDALVVAERIVRTHETRAE